MAEKLIFHYHDRGTLIHRLDPRTKTALISVLTIMIFQLPSWSFLMILPVIAAGMLAARFPVRDYSRESGFFAVFTIIIFLTRWWGTGIPQEAGISALRFLMVVSAGMILTDTTDPEDIAMTIHWLLSPISRRIANAAAAQLNLTVSFFPIIFDASQELIEARRSRGEPRLRRPLRRMISIGTQLLEAIIDRAEDISYALESRGFDAGIQHGSLSWQRRDTLVLLITVVYLAALIPASSLIPGI